MDQVGVIWASLLESLLSKRFDEALNEFMRLSNACSRVTGAEQSVASELQKEAEVRLTTELAKEIQQLCKQSISKTRNSGTATADNDTAQVMALLRIRVGADLLSKSGSAASTTHECREPIKQMLNIHLAVRCVQQMNELRARLELKKKAKNTIASADDGFLETIEGIVNVVLVACGVCTESEEALLETLENGQADATFYNSLLQSLHETGANQVKQVVGMFIEDRRIKTYWFSRADELGGLTLPRALRPSSGGASSSSTGRNDKPNQGKTRRPIDDTESSTMDLILHETSQILSLCQEFQGGFLQDVTVDLVTALVRLDELWLTHNISKAVNHAVTYEIEPPILINSIAEDIFHVIGTCFARAVNSQSLFAAEASANNVAGFVSDGFLEMLKELVRRDSPNRSEGFKIESTREPNNSNRSSSSVSSPFIEAINTVSAATAYTKDLRDEMTLAFDQTFHQQHAMAPALLDEAINKMNSLLDDSTSMLSHNLVSTAALRFISNALNPRDRPYELGVAAFERESIVRVSWIKDVVDAQFRNNSTLRESFPRLSHSPACRVIQLVVKRLCDEVESRLVNLRFTALGALQFDKDVRSLCETIVNESNSLAQVQDEGARIFDGEIRSQFLRLRHWAFLLNLERAGDEKEIDFPGKALADEEIHNILKKRVEQDFFHDGG